MTRKKSKTITEYDGGKEEISPTRVRLTTTDETRKATRKYFYEFSNRSLKIPLLKAIETRTGFIAICRNASDAEKMLGDAAAEELRTLGLRADPPLELLAKRTLFIRRLDPIIGSSSPEEIKEELELSNDWLSVAEVTKIKLYTHVIKVRFANAIMVEMALRDGLFAHNIYIASGQIERERFYNVLMCFRCYAVEDHPTYKCKMPSGQIRCSECSSTDHIWRDCPQESQKKCLNCGDNHRTMSMQCPRKKEAIIKQKKTLQLKQVKPVTTNQTQQQTYASKLAGDSRKELTITDSREQMSKATVLTIQALMHELAHPGSYRETLNNLLECNGCPRINIPSSYDVEGVAEAFLVGAALPAGRKINQRRSTKRPRVASPQEEIELSRATCEGATLVLRRSDEVLASISELEQSLFSEMMEEEVNEEICGNDTTTESEARSDDDVTTATGSETDRVHWATSRKQKRKMAKKEIKRKLREQESLPSIQNLDYILEEKSKQELKRKGSKGEEGQVSRGIAKMESQQNKDSMVSSRAPLLKLCADNWAAVSDKSQLQGLNLLKNINDGKFKYVFSNKLFQPEEVRQLIAKCQLRVEEKDVLVMKPEVFRFIMSGSGPA